MIHQFNENLDNKYYLMGWRDAENNIRRRNLQGINAHLRDAYNKGYDMAKPKYNPADDWKMKQANDDTFKENKMLRPIVEYTLPFARHLEVEAIQINNSVRNGINFAKNGKLYEAMEEFKWAINLLEGCINDTEKEGNK